MSKLLFDLQLFDDVDLNTNVTTDAGMSPEMKTYYDKELIRIAGPELVHDQFAQKRNIPKHGGKTIEFRQYENLPKATTPLTEGVTPKGSKVTVTSKTATVDQYGDYAAVSDILQMATIDNTIVEYTDIFGSQAGRTLDTITRDAIAGGTNVQYAGDKTSRSALTKDDVITVKDIKKCVRTLKKMNAPRIEGSYVGIINPSVSYDLMNDPEFIEAAKYGDPTRLFENEIGKIAGVRFVESTEAKAWKSAEDNCPNDGGLAVFGTIITGLNAYGTTEIEGGGLQMIIKPLGSGEDPLNQRSTVGWKAIKVSERLVEQYMVRLESTASDSATAEAN
jgi:N4-gp56 family major capsid protein